MLARLASCTNTLNHHPKEAKSIIVEPSGKFKEVFMDVIKTVGESPMLAVDDVVF